MYSVFVGVDTVLKVADILFDPHFLASGGEKILLRYLSRPNSFVCFVAE